MTRSDNFARAEEHSFVSPWFPNIEAKDKNEGLVEEKRKRSTEDEDSDDRHNEETDRRQRKKGLMKDEDGAVDDSGCDLRDDDHGEVRQPKGIQSPYTPSKKEVEEHNLTHWPFRSWCMHCLKGKARSLPHRRVRISADEKGVPLIAADYMYFNTKEAERKTPTLTIADERTGATFAHVVP